MYDSYLTDCMFWRSFGIQPFEKEYIEIAHFNCEDKFIEPYIDSEEFPPVLVDFLNRNKNNKGAISDICDSMYKNGLVLAKFQDHRQPGYRNDFFVFLRQRPLNIFNDTKKIVKWSIDDQLEYESKIMQMSTPKLCLDTDPNINAEIKVTLLFENNSI